MEKLSEIGNDLKVGSNAVWLFWKHFGQLLVYAGSIGTVTFEEEEKKSIPEEDLSEIEGRYFKLKFKNKNPVQDIEFTTPIDETLIGQDSSETESLFFDDSEQMR